MKKRDVCKTVLMSSDEAKILRNKANKAGMSESEYIRYLVCGINPVEVLPKTFHSDMENLNRIGKNINLITKLALSNGYVGDAEIEFLKEMNKTIEHYYEEIIDKIMAQKHFKAPSCESVNETVDVSELKRNYDDSIR